MDFYSLSSPPPRVVNKIVGTGASTKSVGVSSTGPKRSVLGVISTEVANSDAFRSPAPKKLSSFGDEPIRSEKKAKAAAPLQNAENVASFTDVVVPAPTTVRAEVDSGKQSPEWTTEHALVDTAASSDSKTESVTPTEENNNVVMSVESALEKQPSPPTTAKTPRPSDIFDRARHYKTANGQNTPTTAIQSAIQVSPEGEEEEEACLQAVAGAAASAPRAPVRPHHLRIVFTLPAPQALLDHSCMTLADAVRELTAVAVQREAETLAALHAMQVSEATPRTPAATTGNSIKTTTTTGSASTQIQGNFVIEKYDAMPSRSLRQEGLVVDLQAVEDTEREATEENVTEIHPNISIVINLHTSIDAATKAFIIPRRGLQAGALLEGPPHAVDAAAVVKEFLQSKLPATQELDTVEQTLMQLDTDNHADVAQTTAAISRWANAFCRVLVHAHLTPVQSEERVRSLVLLLRETLRYDITPPMPPLASTRLGTSHAVSAAHSTAPMQSAMEGDNNENPSTPVRRVKPATAVNFTPILLHSASKTRAPITFNYAAGSALLRRSRTPFTPVPKALARYVSSLDQSRPNVSPASFHNIDHKAVLETLQLGLNSMVAQRRQEEEHMRRVTRVKPSKNPRGGYLYLDVDTGHQVSPHQYEILYMAEVQYATEYINAATMVAWEQEAVETSASIREWPVEKAQQEISSISEAKRQRVSWWDQDIEDGIEADNLISVSPRGGAAYLELPLPTDCNTVADNSCSSSVAQLMCQFLGKWIVAEVKRLAEAVQAGPELLEQTPAPATSAREMVPYNIVAAIATAGTECMRTAADNVMAAAIGRAIDGADAEMESAVSRLWHGVAGCLVEYMNAVGRGIELPTQLEQRDVESNLRALAKLALTSPPVGPNDSAVGDQFCLSNDGISMTTQLGQDQGLHIGMSVTDILNDAVQALANVDFASEHLEYEASHQGAFEGISMQMLHTHDGAGLPCPAEETHDGSISPILSAAEGVNAQLLDDDEQTAFSLDGCGQDSLNALQLLPEIDCPDGVIPAVIPPPREDHSPTLANDDEHDEGAGLDSARTEEDSSTHGCTGFHDAANEFTDTGAESVPIPARIGIFSPVRQRALADVAMGDMLPHACTPPRPPRFSFIARAKAALHSVFGSLSVEEMPTDSAPIRPTVTRSVSSGAGQPDDLLAFFSPGLIAQAKQAVKTPRASPRPLPQYVYDLAKDSTPMQ